MGVRGRGSQGEGREERGKWRKGERGGGGKWVRRETGRGREGRSREGGKGWSSRWMDGRVHGF